MRGCKVLLDSMKIIEDISSHMFVSNGCEKAVKLILVLISKYVQPQLCSPNIKSGIPESMITVHVNRCWKREKKYEPRGTVFYFLNRK